MTSPPIANSPPRAWRSFPTRNALNLAAADVTLMAAVLYRQVVGKDDAPVPTEADQLVALTDPFAALVLRRGAWPLTLRAVLAALDAMNADPQSVPQQDVFVVGDGSQLAWTPANAHVSRNLRYAVVRRNNGVPMIMISTGTDIDSEEIFLQIIGWDSQQSVYNYYLRHAPTWVWAGNSWHAFDPASRGKGCFDSHVNGSVVMKERKLPWLHWHSMSATIDGCLAPDDPLRADPLFATKKGAQILQTQVVEPGVRRWTQARLERSLTTPGSVTMLPALLQHVITTTTINLTSSPVESRVVTAATTVRLPLSFFFNTDALLNIVGLAPALTTPTTPGAFYVQSLKDFDFHLQDETGRVADGDVHFAFTVPEAGLEDLDVLDQLIRRGVISRRLAACLLMVDFPNAVDSATRSSLLQYVPASATYADGRSDLDTVLSKSIVQAASTLPEESPEHAFAANWQTANWEQDFARRIRC